jgi:hypothetical protein
MGTFRTLPPALAALAVASALAAAAPAAAAPGDHFTCRASAVRVTGLAGVGLPQAEPTVANPANDPCAAATATLASAPAALASVLSTGAEDASTSVDATSATATADATNPSVLALVLGGLHISQLSASASYQCANGQPVAQSSSQVTGLTGLAQSPVTTSQPQTLHFAGIADVTLNDTITTATSVTQRAATLTLLPVLLGGVQIVLGEASAGVVGNPCPPPPPPSDPDPGPSTPADPGTPPPDALQPPGQPTGAEHAAPAAAPLPAGCVALHHRGWFIRAGGAALGHSYAAFHATTRADGTIRLTTTALGRRTALRVAYRLDGRLLARGSRAVLRSARLAKARAHRLDVLVAAAGGSARITRGFRWADYTAIACEGRRVVGRIATRTVRVGGGIASVRALVPDQIKGTAKLRFVVASRRRHLLRGVGFRLDGRPVRQHERDLAFTAGQLKAGGTQVLTVRLAPRHGRAVTVRIRFRTTRT